MKIKKLTSDGLLEPLTAIPVERNEKLYYNVFHGDPKCWEFRCSVDSRIATVKLNKPLLFDADHYVIKEIKDKDGKNILDQIGNSYFVISKNKCLTHKTDLLLFWDISHTLKEVTYTIGGFAKEIGKGYTGYKDNHIPAPVIEVYGDCKLSYSGIDEDKNIKVTYDYHYDNEVLKRI